MTSELLRSNPSFNEHSLFSPAALRDELTTPSSRIEVPVGHWRGIVGELLDEIDHLGALRR
jgi:hypothetical protein